MSDIMLGMPALLELPSVEANVELSRKLGLSFVELNMNLPAFRPGALPAERLLALTEETGVGFTLHLPEEVDLASFHPSIREGHLHCCKNAIRWAGEFGVNLVNLHLNSGVYFSLPHRRVWIYEKHCDQFVSLLGNSFCKLGNLAQELGITVCIENTGNFSFGFVQTALDSLLKSCGGWLGLTWDIGHDAAAGFNDTPVFEKFQDRIGHVHLHDCDGKLNHQVLFSGNVDVSAMLSLARKLNVGVVIETKTAEALVESVRRLDERGLRNTRSIEE